MLSKNIRETSPFASKQTGIRNNAGSDLAILLYAKRTLFSSNVRMISLAGASVFNAVPE
jgi:hypothetical protein